MKTRSLLLLAALLAGAAAYLARVPAGAGPMGDEASYALISASLWHDRDLAFDHRDLLRAYRTWDDGPAGVTLFTDDGGRTIHYGKPLPYALAALPFYALFGFRGLAVFNALLYAALLAAFLQLRGKEGEGAVPFVLGTFFASAALVSVFRLQPEVFLMACAGFPLLAAWRGARERGERRGSAAPSRPAPPEPAPGRRGALLAAACGALLAAGAVQEPLAALLALPVAVDLALGRQWRRLGLLAAGALLALSFLLALQRGATGRWLATGGEQRRSFAGEFPVESDRDLWQGVRSAAGSGGLEVSEDEARFDRTVAHLPRDLGLLVVGRQIGLLPYLPFSLFALLLALKAPRDRSRMALLAAVAAYAAAALLLRGGGIATMGGSLAVGGGVGPVPLAPLLPAFLLLPESLAAGRLLSAPFLAAALWTSGALAASLSPVAARVEPGAHLLEPPFLHLPLETPLLSRAGLPGYALRSWQGSAWLVPVENFFVEEQDPNGVWVRGGSRSEVVVVSPSPLRALELRVSSLSGANVLTLRSGSGEVTVRFDSEGKRQGTPVELPLEESAREIGFFAPGEPDHVYRLTVESSDGVVPVRRRWHERDARYLGAFLDFGAEVR